MQLNKQIIKGAIVTRYGSQAAAAPKLGIHERRLSRLLNGHEQIKREEMKVLQEKLGVEVERVRGKPEKEKGRSAVARHTPKEREL